MAGSVFPRHTTLNVPNCCRTDSVTLSQDVGVVGAEKDLNGFSIGQLGVDSLCSQRDTMLGEGVTHVIPLRTNEQVRWINALSVIALMQHESVRPLSMSQEPCGGGCLNDTVTSSALEEPPVPLRQSSSPEPAIIGSTLEYLGPESFSETASFSWHNTRYHTALVNG